MRRTDPYHLKKAPLDASKCVRGKIRTKQNLHPFNSKPSHQELQLTSVDHAEDFESDRCWARLPIARESFRVMGRRHWPDALWVTAADLQTIGGSFNTKSEAAGCGISMLTPVPAIRSHLFNFVTNGASRASDGATVECTSLSSDVG
jgi:hypothetical protein